MSQTCELEHEFLRYFIVQHGNGTFIVHITLFEVFCLMYKGITSKFLSSSGQGVRTKSPRRYVTNRFLYKINRVTSEWIHIKRSLVWYLSDIGLFQHVLHVWTMFLIYLSKTYVDT